MERVVAGRFSPQGVTSVPMHMMCGRIIGASVCHIFTVKTYDMHGVHSHMPI